MERVSSTFKAACAAAALSMSVGAWAATIPFADTFDSYAAGGDGTSTLSDLNWTGGGTWAVASGTVDLVANGDWGIGCYGGSGKCIDLDGSTNDSGVMATVASSTFTLVAGQTYQLSARISGNQRGGNPDGVIFGFRTGSTPLLTETIEDLASTSSFALYTLVFTPATTITTAQIFFSNMGGYDSIGPILDNVSLTAVPVPAAAWLMLSGLIGLGAVARRRVGVTGTPIAAA